MLKNTFSRKSPPFPPIVWYSPLEQHDRKLTLLQEQNGDEFTSTFHVNGLFVLQMKWLSYSQLVFESTIGNGQASDIAVDDISITDGSCGASDGSCSFEDGMCTWTLLNRGSSWLLSSSITVYTYKPSADHTLSLANGKLNFKKI